MAYMECYLYTRPKHPPEDAGARAANIAMHEVQKTGESEANEQRRLEIRPAFIFGSATIRVECIATQPEKRVATDAIIAVNVEESLLLQLPLEIRRMICSEVIGNPLIHIDYHDHENMTFEQNEEAQSQSHSTYAYFEYYGSAWRHIVCRHDCPEDHPEQKFIPDVEDNTFLWVGSHFVCDTKYIPQHTFYPISSHDHEAMDLRVLRASRQIYNEANEMLWTTNTFSFVRFIAFERFMMTRHPDQKRSIRSLRFEMGGRFWWVPRQDTTTGWDNALSSATVKMLSNLRSLRLKISDFLDDRKVSGGFDPRATDRHSSDPFTSPYWSLAFQVCSDGLLRLSTLPLSHVDVGIRGYNWPEQDRKEAARYLKAMLLNSNGAQIYAETKEAREKQLRECMKGQKG
ncbi:MAG: hypothetical protein Q9203_001488 [Teloschistes exilis]